MGMKVYITENQLTKLLLKEMEVENVSIKKEKDGDHHFFYGLFDAKNDTWIGHITITLDMPYNERRRYKDSSEEQIRQLETARNGKFASMFGRKWTKCLTPTVVYLYNFFIKEQYQKNGLGRLLMNEVIKDFGNNFMYLNAGATEGTSQQRLVQMYSSFGFVLANKKQSGFGCTMVRPANQ